MNLTGCRPPSSACPHLAGLGLAVALLALALVGWGVVGAAIAEDGDPGLVRFVGFKPNQPEVWEEIYRLFAREHPGLRVEPVVGPHSSTALHDLLTQKLKNQSPEVDAFLMDVIWPPEFASAGWARPLDDLFTVEDRQDLLPGPLLANTWRGRLYGAPLYLDAGLLYYRRDLLERHGFVPPRTWDELVEQAKIIAAAETAQGRLMAGYSGQFKQYEGLVCDVLEFVYGAGGGALDESGRCGLGQPASLAALGFLRRRLIGTVAPRGVLTYQEPESLALFVQGQAVFLRSWPYAWSIINDPARSRVAGRAGLCPLPAFIGGQSVAVLGGWQVGVSAFTRRPRAALAWVRFLASPRVQKRLALSAGWAPVRRSLYDDPYLIRERPYLRQMLPVFASARPRPQSPLYPALSHVMQRYFHRALAEPDSDLAALAARACRQVQAYAALAQEAGR